MPFRSFSIAAITSVIIVLAGFAHPTHAADYKINFVRPYKVGDEFNMQATILVKRSVRGNLTTIAGELNGAVKVLAVNERTGGITQLQCTVEKMTQDGNEAAPAGVVITAQKADRVDKIILNGRPATSEQLTLLRPIFSLSDPAAAISDDQALGTDAAQPIGGAWPVNKQVQARQLAENGMPISAASVKGESKLANVRSVGRVEVMVIRTTFSCDLEPHRNPGNAAVIGGSVRVNQELVLPIDVSLRSISVTVDMRLTETALTRSGKAAVTEDIQMTRNDQPKK